MIKDYIRLIKFLKGHEKLFSIAVVTMFVSSFFEVFQMSLLVPLIDNVFTGKKIAGLPNLPPFLQTFITTINDMPTKKLFAMIVIVAITLIFVKNFFVFVYQYLMTDVSQRVMRDIRYDLFAKVQNLSLDYFSKKRTGELISRITNDVNAIENAVSYGLTDLFRQTFVIIFSLIAAFTLNAKAALIIFVMVPFIGWPMASLGKTLRKISRGIQEKVADITTHLLETISGIRLVKAFNTEEYEIKRFKGLNHDYYKLLMKSIKRMILIPPVTEVIGGLFAIALICWFAPKMMSGHLSFGVFGLFLGSILTIISPIKKLGNVNALTQKALAASDRIYDILDAKITVVEKENPVKLNAMTKSIELKNVGFHYATEYGNVLKNINLEIKKGDLVAIVGPTGSGKSTLVNLIPRFYDTTTGSVLIDGVDVRDFSFSSLRNQFGIVTQETILFNDSVKGNILYGSSNIPDAQIEAAAKKAFAHNFITKMPKGYDTVIGDRGFRLSGGERQRISIARAILRNPPILILDEATSQLDSESEKFIQQALDELMQGRTVIAIAHRLSTIIKADKIVVIEQGQIVGIGKHEELLNTCALYKKLYTMQFQI